MARWRAEAIKRLPELRRAIESADSVMAAWIEIQSAFETAYSREPSDESLIDRIYSFADWCIQAPRGPDAGHDPLSAAVVSFYEHIPAFPAARADMPRWFDYQQVAENRDVFAYHIGEESYQELLKDMERDRSRHRPRSVHTREM